METSVIENKNFELRQPWGIKLKTFNMLMHLSQLLGFVVPGAGFIAPLVMWLSFRDDYEEVDRHGKIIVNWMLSSLLYMVVSFMLIFAFIGIVPFLVIPLLCTIFAVIGAVKASEDEYWEYPLTIKFFK